MGGGGGGSQHIGWKYFLGMHLQITVGDVDEFQAVYAGERLAWEGTVTANETIYVNKPDLFGGERKEGGVQGYVDVEFGREDQQENPYLKRKISDAPEHIPAFRGVFGLVLKHLYLCAGSPYVKPWALRLRRQPAKGWYPAKANINNGSANPAHMIYECWTSSIWGMGESPEIIDDDSFRQCADTLYDEGFGLSMGLFSPDEVEGFIQDVCRHCQATCGEDPATGKITMKLIRDDYDPDTIPKFSTSDGSLLSMEKFARPSPGDIVNELTLTYRPRGKLKDAAITGQNLASIAAQGGVIHKTVDFVGLDTPELANRVLARELQNLSAPLATVEARLNRTAWNLIRGEVVRLEWEDPFLGNMDMVIRITDINYGNLRSNAITITGVQDIFSMEEYSYLSALDISWTDPVKPPAPMAHHRMEELTYWDIVRLRPGQLSVVADDEGFVQYFGMVSDSGTFSFDLYMRPPEGIYRPYGTGSFCPAASLADPIDPMDTVVETSRLSFEHAPVREGSYAVIDNEIVRIDDIDLLNDTVTIGRGCLDTVATRHNAGAMIFAAESFRAVADEIFLRNQTLQGQGRTRSGMGVLPDGQAPEDTITICGRQAKPYPPGRFRMNNLPYPDYVAQGDITVSWTHRDRTQQTVTILDEGAGHVGPEAGVSYALEFFKEDGTVAKTVTNITAAEYTWDTEVADSGLGRENSQVRIRLWAVRDGLASYQAHDHTVLRNLPPFLKTAPSLADQTGGSWYTEWDGSQYDFIPHTLLCTSGAWDFTPTGYLYQWFEDDVILAGATLNSYETSASDIGKTYTCRVIAANAHGDSAPVMTSNQITVPPVPAPPPPPEDDDPGSGTGGGP